MTRVVVQALLSHWARQPLQLLTLLAGLALATGLWSAVQAINAEARASYARATAQLGADAGPVLLPTSGSVSLTDFVTLRRVGWQVSPVLEGRARFGANWITVLGIEPLTTPDLPAFQTDADTAPPDLAGFLLAPGLLLANPDTATLLAGVAGLPPVSETAALPPGTVLTDIVVAQRLLRKPGEISYLRMLPQQPPGLRPVADLVPGLVLKDATSSRGTGSLTDSFHLNLTAFGLLSFAVGLFIVHGTIGLAFEQRRGMFRTLRALGVSARHLTVLVLAELIGLALLAGTLGLVLGYLVAAALLPDVAATLRGLYGAPVSGGLGLRPVWFASGLAMAVAGALIAGGQGIWRLAALPILAGAGARAWAAQAARSVRWQAVAGLVLFGLGLLALLLLDGLLAGFALLAGMMLGAALVLPLLLDRVLRLGQRRANGPLAEWIWADMRVQLPGISLALMALLLALATNIGVGTMVSSFRLTFTGWLDQRLASELYVTVRSDAEGTRLENWLRTRADAVLPIQSTQSTLNGAELRIYGIVDHATYRDFWPLIAAEPDLWDQVAEGRGTVISEQLARRANLWPGQQVTLAMGWQMRVVGVYSDYGNPMGQAIVSRAALLRYAPTAPNLQFGVRVAPGGADGLARDILAAFDLPPGSIVNQSQIKARSLGVFDKTFVVTGALNVLTLGVAGFAILTSLLTLWTMRLPHLSPVWALGVTRADLARYEMLRSLALAAITALLALPLGLALAWVLLAVINVEAFGWRLPMHLFPLDWLRLGVLAMLAAAAAAALPARRLRRTPPADLLKVFASEH